MTGRLGVMLLPDLAVRPESIGEAECISVPMLFTCQALQGASDTGQHGLVLSSRVVFADGGARR
jgi:hypothetical protein